MPGNYRYEEERSRGPRGGARRGGFGERGRDDDDMEQYEGERFGGGQYGREYGGRGEQQGGYEGSWRESGGGGREYGRSLGGRGDDGYDEQDYRPSGGRDSARYAGGPGGDYGQGQRGSQGRWGTQREPHAGYGSQYGGQYGGAQGYGGSQGAWQGGGQGSTWRGSQGQQSWQGGRSGSTQGDGWTREPDEMRWGRHQGLYGSSEYGGYISSQRSQADYQSNVGKGPKGWRRSDERIREEVSEALARHPDIDASEVEVRVQNGEIVLTGTVTDRRAKRLAEDVAEGVFGASDVQNQIKVNASSQQTGAQPPKSGDRDVTGTAEREGRSGSERTETESRRTSSTAAGTTR